MSAQANAVIVGASAAGLAAADGLRDGGWLGTITVLGEERHHPYDRPMLSKALLERHTGQPAHLRSLEQLTEREIEVRTGQAARGLDIDRRLLVTSDGDVLPWDALVVATGSRPRSLTTADGVALPTLRTIDDLKGLRAAAESRRSVTLVGAGLIGLEVASALRSRGTAVTVVSAETTPLQPIFGPTVARWMWQKHVSSGVTGELGRTAVSVQGVPHDYSVNLDNGTVLKGDLVFASIGVTPCDEWLDGSGVRRREGVLCDRAGRTNVQGVWTAGDVARIEGSIPEDDGLSFGHWTNAVEQGRQVGLNIARGEERPYHSLRSFWTVQHGLTVRTLGTPDAKGADEMVEGELNSDEFVILHSSRDGDWSGVTACRRDRSLREYRKLLLANGSLEEARDLAHRQK
ncbi:FAD-dependent oxidoreductase [Rhodococcus sp. USK13]|uniref:NAD(P)/FAD-dependent oxidoreductase n=1 Tax=Rhodococcus sp. USK13 TaxID=2806442 RepID=UPI0020160E68|nr:FAD-dependent oxidoreductase [Rhodococcus sp. USK13]